MFADAVELASRFTFPVVVAYRHWDGEVNTSAGAFVVLNSDGWIVTAAHMFLIGRKALDDEPKVADLRAKIAAVMADTSLRPEARARQLKRLRTEADPKWITSYSFWWAQDGISARDVTLVPPADIAIGRLDPFPATMVKDYPVIKNPALDIRTGRSLCRLGFPFHDLTATFDDSTQSFAMATAFTFFPLDGIYTRTLVTPAPASTKYPIMHIETSSAGLKGQSGGPLFDVMGRVWGIQSRTRHMPLGFSPTVGVGHTKTVEHQFLSLGHAVHTQTLVAILDDMGVRYEMSPD